MKNINKKLILLLLILLSIIIYLIYSILNFNSFIEEKIIPEKQKVNISEYYIYGEHLNMKGSLEITDTNYENISLVLYNGKMKDIEVISTNDNNKIEFYISECINNGIYLDDLNRDQYYLFLKIAYKNPKDNNESSTKYYVLKNNTNYKETIYYTMSKYNNKIIINSENKYETIAFNISKNKDSKIYDITIDPGHQGIGVSQI